MYSLLIPAIVDEHGEDESAAAVEFPDRQNFYTRLIYDGLVPDSLPTLQFRMDPVCLRLDYLGLSNVALAWLCSQRFHDVLTSEAVPCRTYPVEVIDEQTDQPVAQRYYLFIPTRSKTHRPRTLGVL